MEPLTLLSAKLIKQLATQLKTIKLERNGQLSKIASTFGDPISLAKYYVEPNCQHHNPADSDDDVVANLRMSAFIFLNEFISKESQIEDGRNQCILLADAGMGKTSLLIIVKLLQLRSFWPKDYKCELFKLGEKTLDDISKIKQPHKTVLLLDAIDEDPTAIANIKNRIVDLLANTTAFRKVIISCRTQYLPEGDYSPFDHLGKIHIQGYTCPTVFLSLFDDRQVSEYLKKKFPRSEEKRERSKRIITKMDSLRFRPLLLSYVEDFFDIEDSKLSEYDVYDRLIHAWLQREERKIRRHLKRDLSSKELLQICIEIAVLLQRRIDTELIPEDLKSLTEKNPKFSVISDLDIGGRSLLNRNSEGAYRFSHYSIQEFLIAQAVVNKRFKDEELTRATSKIVSLLQQFDWSEIQIDALYFDESEILNQQISNVELSKNSFERATMTSCKIENSNFKGTRFNSANFSDCIFEDVDFSSASFLDAHFYKCQLHKCKFDDTRMSRVTFDNCEIIDSSFQEAKMERSNLIKSCFQDSNLKFILSNYSDFSNSSFIDSSFSGASTAYINTTNTVFTGISSDTINQQSADFSEAKFH